MANIGKLWAGRVFGTNTGDIFIEFTELEPKIKGTLRFMDNKFGLTVYEISATYTDKLRLTGKAIQMPDGIIAGNLEAEAEIAADGNLKGTWNTILGTGGTFNAFPHDISSGNQVSTSVPEQIHTKYIQLGSIRMFAKDMEQLFNQIKKDFSIGRLIVSYSTSGNAEITDYAENLLNEKTLKNITYCKINIQEPEAYGINRGVVIELRPHGPNDIRVQGVQESWVTGKAETLAIYLKNYESTPVTAYKKFGLNVNQLIFLAMLILMPSVTTVEYRALFAISVILLLSSLYWVHSKFIPNTSISLTEKTPNWLSRNWMHIISWLMAILGSVIASFIFYWIPKNG